LESSGSFKVINVDTTEKLVTIVLVVIGSMPMPIWNHFHEALANNGKITTFTVYRYLMPSCTGFLEPRKSRLGPSKSLFNAENFIRSFSMSILSDFGAITYWWKIPNFSHPPSHLAPSLGVTHIKYMKKLYGS